MKARISKSKFHLLIVIFLSISLHSFSHLRNKTDTIPRETKNNYTIKTNNTEGCVPLTIFFHSADSCENCEYFWVFEDGVTSDLTYPYHQFKTPGIYFPSLRLTDTDGIIHESEIKVTVYPKPTAKFNANPSEVSILNPIIEFKNESSIIDNGSLIYEWDFGNENYSNNYEPTFSYLNPGEYTVNLKVTSAFSCSDQTAKIVTVKEHFNVSFPNAFFPGNKSGKNYFYPKGTGAVKEYFLMEIYNRWGEKIFETEEFPMGFYEYESIEGGWDGRSKNTGEFVSNGTYFYVVRIIDTYKDKHVYEGTVTVIR